MSHSRKSPNRRRRQRRRQRWLLAAPLVMLAFVVGAGVIRERVGAPAAITAALLPPAKQAPEPDRPAPPPTAVKAPAPQGPALQAPGPVPAQGSGTFEYAAGRGEVLGSAGPTRRFRVAVERGVNEDVAAFADRVEWILGDPRSWIGNGQVRLQRVSGADAADFTIFLATRETAGQMCWRGGNDIRVGAHPYTSCRTTGSVIINLDRWRLSAGPYLRARIPLTEYRRYVINHEVGHELGQGHQGCPTLGGPAPVMVQQTLTLRGCVPYAWPRRGDRPLIGPPAG
jgi:hypothetical protein